MINFWLRAQGSGSGAYTSLAYRHDHRIESAAFSIFSLAKLCRLAKCQPITAEKDKNPFR